MVSFPNAKINIGLNILSRRQDGYHNISSVFYPIPFEDILEILPSDDFRFNITGLPVPGSRDDNLITRAYHLLKKDHALQPVHVHLHKIIPMGAGLGGGSADASFAIKSLNEVFNLSLPETQMEEYAAQLGSDCPFFIGNRPVLAGGTGNDFSEIAIDLAGKHLVLICPDIHVSSAEAYRHISPRTPEIPLKEIIENLPLSKWKDHVHNDFEESVFSVYPEIRKIKTQLYSAGAAYASMTGSGAAVYGIFEKEPGALPFERVSWQGVLP